MKGLYEGLAESMDIAAGIPRAELDRLKGRLSEARLAKGDFFLRAGEVPGRIGYVAEGLLRLSCLSRDGKDYTKHFAAEGTLAISYSAFLLEEPSGFSIQAMEESRLLVLGRPAYLELISGHPCWRDAARKLSDMLFIAQEKRGLELLSCDAEERYRRFQADYPGLEGRINQYYIASYLGISPESLSRVRRNRSAS